MVFLAMIVYQCLQTQVNGKIWNKQPNNLNLKYEVHVIHVIANMGYESTQKPRIQGFITKS